MDSRSHAYTLSTQTVHREDEGTGEVSLSSSYPNVRVTFEPLPLDSKLMRVLCVRVYTRALVGAISAVSAI